jgi:hypothetical protein
VAWKRLKFSASKFLLTATTSITADYQPSGAAAAAIKAPLEGTATPVPSPTVGVLTSKTDLPFGKHEVTTVWLDPTSGAVAQGSKLQTGKKPYEKIFRYTREGFFFWRNSPANAAEAKGQKDLWTHRRTKMVRTAVPFPEGALVTDSYALIYVASAARLDREGSTLVVHLLQNEKLVELRFTSFETRDTKCELTVGGSGGERLQTSAKVRRVTLTGRVVGQPAAAGKGDDVDLPHMGLRGSLTMLVEVGTGIPLEFSGRTDTIGELTVRLQRVDMR